MLTPQEVSEHSFSKASFGGYHMGMVDEFLDVLTEDYTALYQENATLKAKMKVLVEKVEDYRSTEDAMRKTLVTAQRMADEMVEEAKKKQAQMTADAEIEAKNKMDALALQQRQEAEKLAAIKASTENYVAKVQALYVHEMEYLEKITTTMDFKVATPVAPAAPVAPTTEEEIPASVGAVVDEVMDQKENLPTEEEIRANLYQVLQEERAKEEAYMSGATDAEEQSQPEEESLAMAATRRIDFQNLQFGKDYEIS